MWGWGREWAVVFVIERGVAQFTAVSMSGGRNQVGKTTSMFVEALSMFVVGPSMFVEIT